MIDGTAASRSISAAAGRLSQAGEYWVMNKATHTPTGTAIAMAITDELIVTHARLAMPKRGLSPPTVHSLDVRKFALFLTRAGRAWDNRKTAIRVTREMTSTPAPLAAPPKRRSPSRPVPAAWSFKAGPRPSGPGSSSTAETPVMLGTSVLNLSVADQERASIAAVTLV